VARTFEKFKDFIERRAMFEGSRAVVVAVSGGPDSVALLDMLARLRDIRAAAESPASIRLLVAHLDHRLRGKESAEDAEFVRELADRLGFKSVIEAADARIEAENLGRGIEEISREIRYNFLLRAARETGCDLIATGHTMSDQAESFLMRLARGAGLRGLAAMRPIIPAHEFHRALEDAEEGCEPESGAQESNEQENDKPESREQGSDKNMPPVDCQSPPVFLVRPLLCITREEVEEYCRERRLEFRVDSTNRSGDYARNRARRDAVPALRSINRRAVESIARAAEIIAADQDALDHIASKFLDQARISSKAADLSNKATRKKSPIEEAAAYSVEALLEQPAGLRRRMIIEAINRARAAKGVRGRAEIVSAHIRSAERLLEENMSGARISLPGGLAIWREFDSLVIACRVEHSTAGEATAQAGELQTSELSVAHLGELSIARPSLEAGGLLLTIERNQPPGLLEALLEQARRDKDATGRDWLFAVADDEFLPERLLVRPRRAGEQALVQGHRKTKKLKKLMIDHRIPFSRRGFWPVVTTPDDRYVWSPGLPLALEFAAHDKTQRLAILRASAVRPASEDP
jgi:tRNA(Ile)-lysidine synthase